MWHFEAFLQELWLWLKNFTKDLPGTPFFYNLAPSSEKGNSYMTFGPWGIGRGLSCIAYVHVHYDAHKSWDCNDDHAHRGEKTNSSCVCLCHSLLVSAFTAHHHWTGHSFTEILALLSS
ncbi:hypothetical protein BDBG_18017 [Blastomyces gilchristii SLH14081]|uniref:Uncharacterized protein n=1 Tax=Blastomyces gilchristii (strain SLH14081) TaxID=559298 RepID=A0A179V4V7_BLAGS|nr:uncharacterized protein BDBG_18017 [Blastomyces gilchristii SLH14081]OAT14401.1 hypothetical protein BDBG_18017 [Blastomyces gilchristii SLH14081]